MSWTHHWPLCFSEVCIRITFLYPTHFFTFLVQTIKSFLFVKFVSNWQKITKIIYLYSNYLIHKIHLNIKILRYPLFFKISNITDPSAITFIKLVMFRNWVGQIVNKLVKINIHVSINNRSIYISIDISTQKKYERKKNPIIFKKSLSSYRCFLLYNKSVTNLKPIFHR